MIVNFTFLSILLACPGFVLKYLSTLCFVSNSAEHENGDCHDGDHETNQQQGASNSTLTIRKMWPSPNFARWRQSDMRTNLGFHVVAKQ